MAGLACVVCIVVGPTFHNLPELMTLAVVTGVVLGSLAGAVDARLGYCWGELYREPKSTTWLDRSIDGVLRRLIVVQIRHPPTDGSANGTLDDDPRI
jgi:hypothetical protein